MTVVNLQPDAAAGIDTYIQSTAADGNFGITTTISVRDSGPVRKGLLMFDISSLPAGATITSAILTLTPSTGSATNVAVHRALVQWFEGTLNGTTPGAGVDGSTYNLRNHNGSVAWAGGAGAGSGSDYAASATDTEASVVGGSGPNDWDVTADVQAWYAGSATNYGWFILSGSGGVLVHSSDSATPSSRPLLTITYSDADISGSFAGVASFTGTLADEEISGAFAGVAAYSGAMVGWGFMSGNFAGAAAFSGTMPVQEMSGSFAGTALFSGEGRAILLPQTPIWKVYKGDEVYEVSGGNPFWRIEATGLGLPPTRNIKQRGPSQHGATRRGFRYDERILQIAYIFKAPNPTTADLWRDLAAEIWAPLEDDELIVEVTRSDGLLRRIRASLLGMMDLPDTPLNDRIGLSQRFVVQLECANPIWWDPELKNLVFTATAGGNAGWQIPAQIPWIQQAGDAIDQTEVVHYTGKHKAFPQIVVTGPGQGLEITNQATGLKIKLKSDVVISAGDVWTFDLRFGTKTVRDINNVLHNGDLDSTSSIGDWAVEPAPRAPGGINNIRVQIPSNATEDTRVQMIYYDQFAHG